MVDVFLVEDNPADVMLVRIALAQVPFRVNLKVAKDGEEALKILNATDFEPQLIILDLNMPRVDGQTVLQRYRETAKVPIVIFSSTQNKIEVQKALALGAREYIQKPTGFEPYAAAVRGMVNRWVNFPEASESPDDPLAPS